MTIYTGVITLKFECGGVPRISIDVPCGIYVFEPESANGKTRLAKLVTERGLFKQGVQSISYNDYAMYRDSVLRVIRENQRILIVDRYDLWCNDVEVADAISKREADRVTLIDVKSGGKLLRGCISYVGLSMTRDVIEVRP